MMSLSEDLAQPSDLAPCPCGGAAVLAMTTATPVRYRVRCTDETCWTGPLRPTPEDAAGAWWGVVRYRGRA